MKNYFKLLKITGKTLKTAIRAKDLTQEQAANKLGITRQTLSVWLKMDTIGSDVIQSVKEQLGIDLSKDLGDPVTNEQDEELNSVPMYNAPAAASGVEVYTDRESGKVVGYISFPGITKGSYALQVYGTSMHPTLESGSWVVLRPIENKEAIVWGQVYYIEWENYRLFKRLLQSENHDEVILWSDNQHETINDRPKHSAIVIKKHEIRKLSLLTDIYIKANH